MRNSLRVTGERLRVESSQPLTHNSQLPCRFINIFLNYKLFIMQKIMTVALATITLLYACSPKMDTTKNTLSTDNNGKPMLIGACSRSALEKAPFAEWFNKNYRAYKVNDTITALIKPLIVEKKFLLFMGTWCGDSKREIPRMLKILQDCGVKKSDIRLVMVDNHDSTYKQSPGHEEMGLNIHRVPTMIVYENSNELGRIVESPVVSIEKDLFAILNKENYKPNYNAVVYMDSLFKNSQLTEIENKLSETAELVKPVLKNAAELNTYGYVLMARKEPAKALLVFKLNILLYPKNANVYDSMGEYYFNTGNKNEAKENYKKVLELDPKNENAKEMLEKIGK